MTSSGRGLAAQHLVGDPRQRRDEGRQGKSRVHQPTEGIDRPMIDQKRGRHLDGAIPARQQSRGFEIQDHQLARCGLSHPAPTSRKRVSDSSGAMARTLPRPAPAVHKSRVERALSNLPRARTFP